MYYYNVVASICDEICRTDSYLVCGGFCSEEEAMNYINENDVSEGDYYKYCKDNEVVYIEIEKRRSFDGSIIGTTLVD